MDVTQKAQSAIQREEKQLKRRAEAAVQRQQAELLELGELLVLHLCPEDVIFTRLATALERGFIAGHMAGRADAYVAVEALAEVFTS